MFQPLLKSVWKFLRKLKIELPYKLATPLLGICLEKTLFQKDICIPVFKGALFTIAKIWKQTDCPSTIEWIKKLWHIHICTHTDSGILVSHKNFAICNNMFGLGGHYAK